MNEVNRERLSLYRTGDPIALYGCFPAELGIMETQSGEVRSIDWKAGIVKIYCGADDECRTLVIAAITAVSVHPSECCQTTAHQLREELSREFD
ncbi:MULTISPECIES: hypothetical protein [Pseudomonas]|uniref:Uncharacterized protein n=1 Tax=Pseudomonas fluorescens TaxID=294 RepID=A0A5E6TR02_PSEFL|nr:MULTISPECIES: hypothetical protein [Pseudomonas]VVM95526.1 hypothetical protein PS652_03012 [Pseudomonas fluorescens]